MERIGSLDRFPSGWTDPLELYGDSLPELKAAGCNMDTERNTIEELVDKFGARWVWNIRRRLVSVAKALKDYPRKR